VTFTDREKEVLELLVAGRSNKEIGAVLGIEERTVKAHVAKLMRKVGVQNRIALSVHAITHNLVTAKYRYRRTLTVAALPMHFGDVACFPHDSYSHFTYHRTWEMGVETGNEGHRSQPPDYL